MQIKEKFQKKSNQSRQVINTEPFLPRSEKIINSKVGIPKNPVEKK